MKILSLIQGLIFFNALILFPVLVAMAYKKIWSIVKEIPTWLVLGNLFLLIYKITLPLVNSSRSDYGAWIIGMARQGGFIDAILSNRSPVYFFIIKIYSFLVSGASYELVVYLNIFFSFVSIFCVYLIVKYLFNKDTAVFATAFYALSPINFVFSLNEDYSNPAVFFAVLTFFFATVYIKKEHTIFLIISVLTALMSIGSRPEYIIFFVLYLLYILWFAPMSRNQKIMFGIIFVLLILPWGVIKVENYSSSITYDPWIHSGFAGEDQSLFRTIMDHSQIFMKNFVLNIRAIFKIKTLMGVYLLFVPFVLYSKDFKKYYKYLVYFFVYYILIFFYYAYLHNEGLYESYKYIISLIFPLVVLSAFGLSALYAKNKLLPSAVLILLCLYVPFIVSPLGNKYIKLNRFDYSDRIQEFDVEYELFKKSLKSLDERNAIFIPNGGITYFYSATTINDNKIFPVYDKNDLLKVLKDNSNADNIYISQGTWGFGDYKPDYYEAEVGWFWDEMLKYLDIKEELISFEGSGKNKVFLYKTGFKDGVVIE